MLLCADADAASADRAGIRRARLPSCGTGRLWSWGYGRERVIRVRGGARRLQPWGGRCRSCGATHVLLPSWGRSPAGGRRRGDRAGGRVVGCMARERRGTRHPGRDRSRLAVPLRARVGQLLKEAGSEFGRLVAVIETRRAVISGRPGRRDHHWATRWRWSPRAPSARSGGTALASPDWTR